LLFVRGKRGILHYQQENVRWPNAGGKGGTDQNQNTQFFLACRKTEKGKGGEIPLRKKGIDCSPKKRGLFGRSDRRKKKGDVSTELLFLGRKGVSFFFSTGRRCTAAYCLRETHCTENNEKKGKKREEESCVARAEKRERERAAVEQSHAKRRKMRPDLQGEEKAGLGADNGKEKKSRTRKAGKNNQSPKERKKKKGGGKKPISIH